MFDLQQQQVLERYKHPHYAGRLTNPDLIAEGANEFCGDEVRIELHTKKGIIAAAVHTCRACAVCSAAADLLLEHLENKSLSEATAIETGEMLKLIGIPLSPVRTKCALLPLETLKSALKEAQIKAG